MYNSYVVIKNSFESSGPNSIGWLKNSNMSHEKKYCKMQMKNICQGTSGSYCTFSKAKIALFCVCVKPHKMMRFHSSA
jgi:hypothetical protein